MDKYLIYSVEDDENISRIINLTLKKQGYDVVSFVDGESFLDAFSYVKPNMVLLDMMLPGIQGIDLLNIIRKEKENKDIVVIIVSAKSLTSDKVEGLDQGADDYISKPFELVELLSRVNAHARRYVHHDVISIGNYLIDFDNMSFKSGDKLIVLTNSEFLIAGMLFKKRGETVTKAEISKKLYGETTDEIKLRKQYRTIDMHVKAIRQKIGDTKRDFIVTEYSSGFRIN